MDTRSNAQPKARPLRTALMLAAAAVLTVGTVAVVQDLAGPRIAANERAQRVAKLVEVLGDARYDNDILADVVWVTDPELLGTDEPLPAHRARLGGQPVAVLLTTVAPDGYSASIRLLVAIREDGRLLGVRVLTHRETPGLGDGIERRKSTWIDSFTGRSLDDPSLERWKVRKDGGDFDQFTGATVTPRAVVGAVRNALLYFDAHRTELLDAPAAPQPGR